jgi:hypothetical protein
MRIARVLLPETIRPIVALERDGALYDVEKLEHAWDRDPLGSDFHRRLVALRGAGLAELDERLGGGARPTVARIAADGFLWLAPCDTARAACMHVDLRAADPHFWLGSARRLLGQGSRVDAASGSSVELALGVLLGDDLRAASAQEADAAMAGFAPTLRYGAPSTELESAVRAHVQIGPTLVTRDEAKLVHRARSRLRVGSTVIDGVTLDDALSSAAAALAWVSRDFDFEAGDLVIFGPLAQLDVEPGQAIAGAIERLGTLTASARAEGQERMARSSGTTKGTL